MKRREILTFAAATSLAAAASPAFGAPVKPGSADGVPLEATHNVPINVAFVVGNSANVMDFAGPWEVFQDTMIDGWDRMAFHLFMVSDRREPIEVTGGMRVLPKHAFGDADLPQPGIIVMGAQGEHTAAKIAWIREAGRNAEVVMSVCTGAFLLAQTGAARRKDCNHASRFFRCVRK